MNTVLLTTAWGSDCVIFAILVVTRLPAFWWYKCLFPLYIAVIKHISSWQNTSPHFPGILKARNSYGKLFRFYKSSSSRNAMNSPWLARFLQVFLPPVHRIMRGRFYVYDFGMFQSLPSTGGYIPRSPPLSSTTMILPGCMSGTAHCQGPFSMVNSAICGDYYTDQNSRLPLSNLLLSFHLIKFLEGAC